MRSYGYGAESVEIWEEHPDWFDSSPAPPTMPPTLGGNGFGSSHGQGSSYGGTGYGAAIGSGSEHLSDRFGSVGRVYGCGTVVDGEIMEETRRWLEWFGVDTAAHGAHDG